MRRFAIFVDGSNLLGSLKKMNLEVQDYEALFGYLYEEARSEWQRVTHAPAATSTELRRIYWYAVGSMDHWDLSQPQARTALRDVFLGDKETRDFWLAETGRSNPGVTGEALTEAAWQACLSDFTDWYEKKCGTLDGMKRFYHSVRNSTNLIDIAESGHWKVDFMHKRVGEKGLDASLAVDMIALQDNLDIAVVVSGDADSIPSICHLKERNKHVASVEFVNGSPPEARGRSFSSRLKEHSDFVVRVYESELLRLGHGARPAAAATP